MVTGHGADTMAPSNAFTSNVNTPLTPNPGATLSLLVPDCVTQLGIGVPATGLIVVNGEPSGSKGSIIIELVAPSSN